jgi:hypothetical protein
VLSTSPVQVIGRPVAVSTFGQLLDPDHLDAHVVAEDCAATLASRLDPL